MGQINLNDTSAAAIAVRGGLRDPISVKSYGATGDGSTDDSTAIQAAITAANAINTGVTVYLPNGTYRINTGIVLASTRVNFVGQSQAGTVLQYHGSGTALDVTADGSVRLEDFAIENTGGTGLVGVMVGSATAYTGWRYQLSRIKVSDFDTAGFHFTNCEQTRSEYLWADGCAIGFLVDDSRHTGPAQGVNNTWEMCRAYESTGQGWDVYDQIGPRFINCQSLRSAGTNQFQLRGTNFGAFIEALDVETASLGTTCGLLVSGERHTVSIAGFSLSKGVEFSAATGCMLMPCRFSSVTTPVTVGATCVDLTLMDGGNLGTVSEGAPSETHYIGARLRSERVEVRGTGATGYIEFSNEQTSDPGAIANRGRLYIKDDGAGKTQLVVRFGSGAVQVIATEP